MTTFSDRLDQTRQASQARAEAAAEQQQAAWQAHWEATVEQLKRLIEAELEIVDFPEPVHVHKDHSHGSPETDYAVVKFNDLWLALPVTDNPASDTHLLGLLHCPNGHIQGLEYPHSADDSWGQALLRMDERNNFIKETNACDAERTPRPIYDTRVGPSV